MTRAPSPRRRAADGERATESQVVEDLVVQAARGERAAQEELLARFWPLITVAVRARKRRASPGVAAREATADLEQEAALKLLSRLGRHQWRGRSAFAAWVKQLASRNAADVLRRHRARRRDARVEASVEVEAQAAGMRGLETMIDAQAESAGLLKRLSALKPEYATALLMAHMGFSLAETGEVLGVSAEAARKLVARARVRLVDLEPD
jgi:RNA polymerase sigma factor (sigma-70 family)